MQATQRLTKLSNILDNFYRLCNGLGTSIETAKDGFYEPETEIAREDIAFLSANNLDQRPLECFRQDRLLASQICSILISDLQKLRRELEEEPYDDSKTDECKCGPCYRKSNRGLEVLHKLSCPLRPRPPKKNRRPAPPQNVILREDQDPRRKH